MRADLSSRSLASYPGEGTTVGGAASVGLIASSAASPASTSTRPASVFLVIMSSRAQRHSDALGRKLSGNRRRFQGRSFTALFSASYWR
jgi:hypothetical protein